MCARFVKSYLHTMPFVKLSYTNHGSESSTFAPNVVLQLQDHLHSLGLY